MKRLILLFLCSIPVQMSAFPFDAYDVAEGRRVDLPQWNVVAGNMAVNNALGIPALGVYDGSGYRFRFESAIVVNTPRLLEVAPKVVQDQIAGKDAKIYTIYWSPQGNPVADGHENIVLHPVVRRWQLPTDWSGVVDDNGTGFNLSVQAGIFGMSPNVLTRSAPAIVAGRLGHLNVNYHDRIHFSPDNGRIVLPKNPDEVATYWLVAVSPFDNRAIVVFNIVGSSFLFELANAMGRDQYSSTGDVLNEMAEVRVSNPAILRDAVNILRHDLGGDAEEAVRAERVRQEAAERERAARVQKEEAGRLERERRVESDRLAALRLVQEEEAARAERVRQEVADREREEDRVRVERERQVESDRLAALRLVQAEEAARAERVRQEAAERERAARVQKEEADRLERERRVESDRLAALSLAQEEAAARAGEGRGMAAPERARIEAEIRNIEAGVATARRQLAATPPARIARLRSNPSTTVAQNLKRVGEADAQIRGLRRQLDELGR
jgi:hypothetical protein